MTPSFPPLLPVLALFSLSCISDKQDDTWRETPQDTAESGDSALDFEPGCITVDGHGGYAYLVDALSVAHEGSLIEICAGEFQESIQVEMALSIKGAGPQQTFWNAPSNQVPFVFFGVDGASLVDMSIGSTRNGVEIRSSSSVTLENLEMHSIPNFGIYAVDSDSTVVNDSTFAATEWGGVFIEGGDAYINDCVFTDNMGFAVKASDGADLLLNSNQISGTTYTELDDDGYVVDGFAVFADEAGQVDLMGNTFHDNLLVAVFADSVDSLYLSGDEISGGLYGIYQWGGDLEMQDVTIQDPTEFGIYFVAPAGESLDAYGLMVSGDPAVVSDYDIDSSILTSIGLYAEADHVSVADSSFEGYQAAGLYLLGYSASGAEAELQNLVFQDNGAMGIRVFSMDVAANEVQISGLRGDEYEMEDGSVYVDYPAAAAISYGNLDWTGGGLESSQGWGISAVYSGLSIDGATFIGGAMASVMDYGSTSIISNSTFSQSESTDWGTVCGYQSSGLSITGNQFVENDAGTQVYDYSEYCGVYYDCKESYLTYYYDRGLDIYLYDSDSEISGNTFQNGDWAIYQYDGRMNAHDNQWSTYGRYAIYAVYGETSISNSTLSDCAGYNLYTYLADLELSEFNATDGAASTTSYETWTDGKLTYSYEYDSYNAALSLNNTTAILDGVNLANHPGPALYGYDSSIEIEDLNMDTVGSSLSYYDTITLRWYYEPVSLYALGVSITNSGYGDGISLIQNSDASFEAVFMQDLQIDGSPGAGIKLDGLEDAYIAHSSVADSGGSGLEVLNSSLSLNDLTISSSGQYGMKGDNSTIDADACTISDNGDSGIYMNDGTLILANSWISGNSGDGLSLHGTDLSATANVISKNEGWGMSCWDVVVSDCGNLVEGNVLGENNGCDESCLEVP